MSKLRSPVPFRRPKRGELPGQSSGSLRLGDEIIIKTYDTPSATIINRELIQVGNVGVGKYVEIDLDGIQLLSGALGKIFLNTDGDVFVGTDISSPSTTHLAIFANAQAYNGEAMGVGDFLLGDNTAGAANIFWDASAGQMYLRTGTTITQALDGDGDFFLGSDISDPDLTFLAFFANDQTYNSESVGAGDLLIGSNSAGKPNIFWDASAGQLSMRLGVDQNIVMDSNGTIISQSNITKVDIQQDGDVFLGADTSLPDSTAFAIFAAGQTYNSQVMEANDILIGSNSAGKPNIFWDASAGQFLFRLGTTNNIVLDGDGLELVDGATVKIDLQSDGDLFIGPDTSSPSSTALAVFANPQTYNSEAVEANDVLFGDNSASSPNIFWDASAGEFQLRLGTDANIKMDASGTIIAAGGITQVDSNQDGDLFVGRDTSDPDKTALAVFANSQTYNLESVGAGDVMLGSNSANQHNVYWDDSTGELLLRDGTTNLIELDGTTVLIGDSTAENLRIATGSVRMRQASTDHMELASSVLRLGPTASENILISAASGINFREAGTSFGQLSGSALRLGQSSYENIRLTTTELQIRDSSTVYAELAAGLFTLGQTSDKHIRISPTNLTFRDGATVMGTLGTSELTLGSTTSGNLYLTTSALQLRQSSTVYTELASGVLTVGNTSNEHVRITSSTLQVKDGSTVYTELSGGDLTVGRSTQDHVKITSSGVQIKDSGTVRGEWQTDGDIFIGKDISAANSTFLCVFSTAQSYNGESMGAGDIMLGSNSAGQHNILWDDSTGELLLRDQTTNLIELDGTTVLVGDSSNENLRITTSAVEMRQGSTVHMDLASSVLRLGATANENILISAASGINFREASTSHAQLTASSLRLGQSSAENILISSASGVNIREGSTSYAQLSSSAMRIGQSGNENLRITSTELQIRDSSTVYTELTGGLLTVGRTSGQHVRISGSNLQLKDGATVLTTLASGSLTLGSASGSNVYLTSSALQLRESSTAYTELSSGVLTIGRTSNEHVRVTSSTLQFKDGSTVFFTLSAGDLTVGDTSQDHVSITSSGVEIKDSGTVRGQWQTDGDIFIGSNISSAANTYLCVFANAQTYNSESVAAGDMLIGDNSSGKANIFWDKSAGQMEFRGGTSTKLYIDTDGSLTAGAGDVILDDSGISIVSGTGNTNKLKVYSGATIVSEYYTQVDGSSSQTTIHTEGKNGTYPEAYVLLQAQNYAGTKQVFVSLSTNSDWIDLSAEVVDVDKALRLTPMTTTTRNGLSATAGMLVYNSTTSTFQGYNGSTWVDLH